MDCSGVRARSIPLEALYQERRGRALPLRQRGGISSPTLLPAALLTGRGRSTTRWTRLPTVERELLAAQVEVATKPTDDIASARAQLLELRTGLTETAREHGLLVFAFGTQPLARWEL